MKNEYEDQINRISQAVATKSIRRDVSGLLNEDRSNMSHPRRNGVSEMLLPPVTGVVQQFRS